MAHVETGPSKRAHSHQEWDPEWIEKRFAGLLVCNFAICGEIAAFGGTSQVAQDVSQDEEGNWEPEWVVYYEVKGIFPAPLPIKPVEATPEIVRATLNEAAALIWQSAEASANQVRQAVEHLMDCQKVKKQAVSKGKVNRLSLHARIFEFQQKDPLNAEVLLAIKWLGNSGSHAGGLTRDKVLDAFDMMELVLVNLYGTSTAEIMKKVKAVNKARGAKK